MIRIHKSLIFSPVKYAAGRVPMGQLAQCVLDNFMVAGEFLVGELPDYDEKKLLAELAAERKVAVEKLVVKSPVEVKSAEPIEPEPVKSTSHIDRVDVCKACSKNWTCSSVRKCCGNKIKILNNSCPENKW